MKNQVNTRLSDAQLMAKLRGPGNPAAKEILYREMINRLYEKLTWQDEIFSHKKQTCIQLAKDASMMACSDTFQMGPGRAIKYSDSFNHYMNEFLKMATQEERGTEYTDADDFSIDYTIDKIDGRLKEICGEEKLIPFRERYNWDHVPELRKAHIKLDLFMKEVAHE